jgi:hypothetical protein
MTTPTVLRLLGHDAHFVGAPVAMARAHPSFRSSAPVTLQRATRPRCAPVTSHGAQAHETPVSARSFHRRAYEVSGRYILPHFKALSSLDNIILPSHGPFTTPCVKYRRNSSKVSLHELSSHPCARYRRNCLQSVDDSNTHPRCSCLQLPCIPARFMSMRYLPDHRRISVKLCIKYSNQLNTTKSAMYPAQLCTLLVPTTRTSWVIRPTITSSS